MKPNLKEASDYIGIITKLSLRYWRKLPPHVQSFFDAEDMVSEVVLSVLVASQRYDPARAAPSTFVHCVAENHCRTLVSKHELKKRFSSEIVSFDDLQRWSRPTNQVRKDIHNWSRPDRGIQCAESRMAMERLIADASENLRRALWSFFTSRQLSKFHGPELSEFRMLVAKHRISAGDLRLVFSII